MEGQVTLVITGGEIKPVITLPSSSTIRQLKMRIKEEIVVSVPKQRLLCENILLLDNTIISDYIHGGTAEVFLSVDLDWEEKVSIFIRDGNEGTELDEVIRVDKVIKVKKQYGQNYGIDPKDIDLWHLGKKMKDNKMLYKCYVDKYSQVKFTRVGYGS